MLEALAILKAAEELFAVAQRLIEAAKAKGDPTPDEVRTQVAASQAANDRLHAIVNG